MTEFQDIIQYYGAIIIVIVMQFSIIIYITNYLLSTYQHITFQEGQYEGSQWSLLSDSAGIHYNI